MKNLYHKTFYRRDPSKRIKKGEFKQTFCTHNTDDRHKEQRVWNVNIVSRPLREDLWTRMTMTKDRVSRQILLVLKVDKTFRKGKTRIRRTVHSIFRDDDQQRRVYSDSLLQ